MGLMNCKILPFSLLNYTTLFKLKIVALPPVCHFSLHLCPKLHLLAAILKQQQVEKIIKKGVE